MYHSYCSLWQICIKCDNISGNIYDPVSLYLHHKMRRFSEMWACDGLKNLTEIGISKCHVIAFFVADLKKRYHFYVPGLRARTIWERLQFDEKEISFEFIALFYSPMRWAKKAREIQSCFFFRQSGVVLILS